MDENGRLTIKTQRQPLDCKAAVFLCATWRILLSEIIFGPSCVSTSACSMYILPSVHEDV